MTKRKENPLSPWSRTGRLDKVPSASLLINEHDLAFLGPLAQTTGVDLDFLAECFLADDDRYIRITALALYLKNHLEEKHPALTLKKVLSTTTQERLNLQTGYQLIASGKLTINEVKRLTEEEHSCIISNDIDEAWVSLQQHREKLFQSSSAGNQHLEEVLITPELRPRLVEDCTPEDKRKRGCMDSKYSHLRIGFFPKLDLEADVEVPAQSNLSLNYGSSSDAE